MNILRLVPGRRPPSARRKGRAFRPTTLSLEGRALMAVVYAVDDFYGVYHDQSIDGNVLENDSDEGVDGSGLTAVVGSPPSHGTLLFNSDGYFRYTPDPRYVGRDSFTYSAIHAGESAEATVRIDVGNTRPVADNVNLVAQTTDVESDTGYPGPGRLFFSSLESLLVAARDDDGDTLTVRMVGSGGMRVDGAGFCSYDVEEGEFSGTAEFQYVVNDGIEDSEERTITLIIPQAADVPEEGHLISSTVGVVPNIPRPPRQPLPLRLNTTPHNKYYNRLARDHNAGVIDFPFGDPEPGNPGYYEFRDPVNIGERPPNPQEPYYGPTDLKPRGFTGVFLYEFNGGIVAHHFLRGWHLYNLTIRD